MLLPVPSLVRRSGGFTLIELLIVISIIAVLAMIAVPNFLEAQTRARVARVKSDLRTLGTAMETYAADYSVYPFTDPLRNHSYISDIPMLTTPIAYLGALPQDPFFASGVSTERERYYRYYPMAYWVYFFPIIRLEGWQWLAMSNGPNREINIDQDNAQDAIRGNFWMVYDVTNGTLSYGDIWVTNRGFLGTL